MKRQRCSGVIGTVQSFISGGSGAGTTESTGESAESVYDCRNAFSASLSARNKHRTMEDFRAGGAADGTSGDGDPEDASAPALEGMEITEVFKEEELQTEYPVTAIRKICRLQRWKER